MTSAMEGEAKNHYHTRVGGSTRGGGTAAERACCCSGATGSGYAASTCTAATLRRLPRPPPRRPRPASDALPLLHCSTAVSGLYNCPARSLFFFF
uniref:Uncharacterized protein n=1 Tax=Arundo donax TaxID=35708 RepID=A0A0A9FZ23_ARUDO